MFEGISGVEDLVAAFQKWNENKKVTGGRALRSDQVAKQQSGDRPPRKCANCGEAHEARTCPKPAVAVSERRCWTCGEKHMSRDCPNKGKSIKAIEDGPLAAVTAMDLSGFFGSISLVDNEGYKTVQRRTSSIAGMPPRPLPGVTGAMGVLSVEPAGETPGQRG